MNRALEEKLKRIEALYQRPGTEGEKQAAARALLKLRKKLSAATSYQRVYQRPVIRDYQFEQFDKKI